MGYCGFVGQVLEMRLLRLFEALPVGCLDCLLMSAGSSAETADMMSPCACASDYVVFRVIRACSLFLFFVFFSKFVKEPHLAHSSFAL